MVDCLVTVVVPIYGVEKYLDRCVTSVVNQTYTNLEIILVDDGSPDRCPEMCDEWARKDNRIKVIHKQNAGLGMARNTGIEHARGKYIFFFDSDDYVDLSIVQKCVKSAEEFSSDAVIYGRCDVYEDGRTVKKAMHIPQTLFAGDAVKTTVLSSMFTYGMGFGVSAWGKMFNLETIRQNQLRFLSEREVISEDAYFALEFFSKASVVTVVDENLYFYYKRQASLSRVFRPDRQERNDAFLLKSLALITEQKLPGTVAEHLKARYHMFSLAAMKQVVSSQLTSAEKRRELRKILKGKTLRSSLSVQVLLLHKGSLRLFFGLLKLRCLPLCEALLYLRNKQED